VAPEPPEPGPPERPPEPPEPGPEPAEPENPLALELPAYEGFARLPLPEADPARYKRWRQRGRIQVGQSHLSYADLADGERLLLAMSSAEGTVRVYERATRKLLGNHAIPGFGRFDRGDVVAWPGTGHEPLFLFGKQDGLWLFSASSGEAVAQLDTTPVWQLRWSPDQRVLVADLSRISTQTSQLTFFHRTGPRELTKLAAIEFSERVDAWDLSRDNRYLVVIYYPSDTLELIDLHTGQALWRIPTPEFGGDVALSPDGRAVAMGGAGLLLVDVADPSKRTLYTRFGNNIGRVRFSPSGDAIVTSSYDGRVRIFGYQLGPPRLKLLKTLSHAGSSNVYELRFFDGGKRLLSTSGDKSIRYWGR
jgi:WD40 repeat protein